jgi:hypothetical protein
MVGGGAAWEGRFVVHGSARRFSRPRRLFAFLTQAVDLARVVDAPVRRSHRVDAACNRQPSQVLARDSQSTGSLAGGDSAQHCGGHGLLSVVVLSDVGGCTLLSERLVSRVTLDAFQNVTLDQVIQRALRPVSRRQAGSFEEGWAAGVLYVGGWRFAVSGDEQVQLPGEYAITAVDEAAMKVYVPKSWIDLDFANLWTPGLSESYEASQAAIDATIQASGLRPPIERRRVKSEEIRKFLVHHGPLTDSFLRSGHDHGEEQNSNSARDPRGAMWAYAFSDAVAAVADTYDLSKTKPDDALESAWLLLDEVPQGTLLKVIALRAFSRLLNGKDMTRCENPSCRRYFQHQRLDQLGCSSTCAAVIRQRRHRAKKRTTKGGKS